MDTFNSQSDRLLERELQKQLNDNERAIYKTELESLLISIPDLAQKAEKIASQDRNLEESDKIIAGIAPRISRTVAGIKSDEAEDSLRGRAKTIALELQPALIDLDEVDCPHCGGRGQRGLAGTLCSYCGGSCFVSTEAAKAYDPEDLDEVECPRCRGTGQTGLVGDICALCKGDCVVSEQVRDAYVSKYG